MMMQRDEFRDRQRRQVEKLRMAKDITMAVVILIVAGILFFSKQLNLVIELSDGFRISLGVLFAVYGGFRLYRGIKKDY